MRLQILIILSSIGLLISSNCFGYNEGRYNIKGYNVGLKWQHIKRGKKNVMELYGEVSGNQTCKQLNVEVYLDNKKDGAGISRLTTAVMPYVSSGSRFYAEDEVSTDYSKKDYWIINDIYFNCIK